MQYKKIHDEIISMKCVKLYKPILMLAYHDFIKLSQNKKYEVDYMVDLNDLLPFIHYYLSQDCVMDSKMGSTNLTFKHIYNIMITGPMYRINSEYFIFKANEVDGIEYFGFEELNESVNIDTLLETVKFACVDLISNYVCDFQLLELNNYTNILTEIRNTKIAPGTPPKIYKYLLILSLLDYYLALGDDINPFNKDTHIDNLVTYYKLNLSTDLFGDVVQNKKVVDGTTEVIKQHIQTMPLRKLCKPNSAFVNNDKNPKSRKYSDYPTTFEIQVSDQVDYKVMQQMIRSTCYELIEHHTGDAAEKSIINKINSSTTYFANSTARKGQKQYRDSLLERYNGTCAICQLDFDPVLVASHAKPWRDCTNTHEKLSPDNGLLLCSYHDGLFDKGYITFDSNNNYNIILSDKLTPSIVNSFKVNNDNKVPNFVENNPKMVKYLAYHKQHIFKK